MGLYKITVALITLIELYMTNNVMYNVSEDVCHMHFLVFTSVFIVYFFVSKNVF